jgi:hypothetical protein
MHGLDLHFVNGVMRCQLNRGATFRLLRKGPIMYTEDKFNAAIQLASAVITPTMMANEDELTRTILSCYNAVLSAWEKIPDGDRPARE